MFGSAQNALCGVAVLVALFACTAVNAAPVTSLDPTTVVSALQNAGYKAKISVDKDGDTSIESASEGNTVTIAFLNCTNGKACDQIELLAFWNCAKEMKRCEALNIKWNAEEVFAHTLMIEKQIGMYRHLLFDKNGMSEELFIRNFEYFSRDAVALMDKF